MSKLSLPKLGSLDIFVYAVVFAILVWLIGMLGAIVLKDVAQPSAATLSIALAGGLIGAGITLVPDLMKAIAAVAKGVPVIGLSADRRRARLRDQAMMPLSNGEGAAFGPPRLRLIGWLTALVWLTAPGRLCARYHVIVETITPSRARLQR